MIDRLGLAHRFLARNCFYALGVAVAVAMGLLAGRMRLSHGDTYSFLAKNLFLACLPYGFALGAAALAGRRPRILFWMLGLLWLAFLPNGPYVVTDLIHFYPRLDAFPWWYDLGMLSAFALTSYLLALVSLMIMQELVQRASGRWVSWLFVLACVALTGVGVYAGRFLRWNSVDLFSIPHQILGTLAHGIVEPLSHRQALGFSVVFASVFLACYLVLAAARAGGAGGRTELRKGERDR